MLVRVLTRGAPPVLRRARGVRGRRERPERRVRAWAVGRSRLLLGGARAGFVGRRSEFGQAATRSLRGTGRPRGWTCSASRSESVDCKRPQCSYLPRSGAAGFLLGGLQQDSLHRVVRHGRHTRGQAAASGANEAGDNGRMKRFGKKAPLAALRARRTDSFGKRRKGVGAPPPTASGRVCGSAPSFGVGPQRLRSARRAELSEGKPALIERFQAGPAR